ncbi:MAG: energy-coupling factor transporter transmembrane component T [Desulfobacteraceae bacterium]|nr:energy-coupling factor transporter transmembrane component T [Desulfobacteraceae bacterium]
MAELSAIAFRPGRGRLHRLDPRFKIAILVLTGAATAYAAPAGLAILSALMAAGVRDARLPLRRLLADIRPLLIMLAFVAAVRAFTIPGPSIWPPLPVSRPGLAQGLLFAWRVLVVVCGGILLSATTRTWALRAAVAWLLAPFPGVPAQRAATMIGLVVRFIPEVLHQGALVREAQQARGIAACRNPLRRLYLWVAVLMRRTLLKSDHLALAMISRGYSEKRTDQPLCASSADAALLALAATVSLAAVLC